MRFILFSACLLKACRTDENVLAPAAVMNRFTIGLTAVAVKIRARSDEAIQLLGP
jgi:hypothetical protein